jgi:hypothetical protein
MPFNSFPGSRIHALLTQYPDKQLLKAQALLGPDEKPTVPVRLYDDPDAAYKEHFGQERGNPLAGGFISPNRDSINVYSKRPNSKSLEHLAAILAHEQRHILGNSEADAYQKQLEVSERSRRKFTPQELDRLRRTVEAWRNVESRKK